MVKQKRVILFLLLLINEVSSGQSTAEDDTAGTARTINYYFSRIGPNAPVYNGSAYPGYGQKIIGSPFFGSDRLESGTLFYDGVVYPGIEMAYDVAADCIIIKDRLNDNLLIRLVNEKIGYFIIHDHFFINSNDGASNGFFDRVYDGKHVVWVKRRKQIEDKPLDEKEKSAFIEYNYYYIKKETQFVPVNVYQAC
ncbi:MAG: hypothetical protein WDO19_32715 [Bacteroidota bacterium]